MTGVSQLGYLGFEVSDLDAWTRFAEEILGVGTPHQRRRAGTRIDGRQSRFFLHQGPRDDLSALGFEAPDADALDTLLERLRPRASRSGPVTRPSVVRVESNVSYASDRLETDSNYIVAQEATSPFASALAPGGFVADGLGLGPRPSRPLPSRKPRLLHRVARLSTQRPYRLRVLRLSRRYGVPALQRPTSPWLSASGSRNGSITSCSRPPKSTMSVARTTAPSNGVRFMNTLGKHPNDEMFSFYAFTPSGFQFEFGYGGKLVDDAQWTHDLRPHRRLGPPSPGAFRGPKR